MYEKVLTLPGWWDGPLNGVALFNGKPHAFQRVFEEDADDYGDEYVLKPITSQELELVMEDWAIWERWREAFDKGLTTKDTHPCLPEDKKRDRELEAIVGKIYKIENTDIKRIGHFQTQDYFHNKKRVINQETITKYEVKWTEKSTP